MKTILFVTTAAAALLSGSAMAADLAVKAPIYKAPPPLAFSWTGCYIGAHAGYHRSSYDQHLQFDDAPPDDGTEFRFTDSLLADGGIGGGQIGCNYQSGTFVWGIEFDGSWAGGSDSRTYIPDVDSADSVAFSVKTNSLWSVRGRVGIAADRALFYATMGWAGARFNYTYNLFDADAGASAASLNFNVNGLVVGAGAEYALTNNIIVGAEFLHYMFGRDQALPDFPIVGPSGSTGDHINLKTVDVARVRISYLFNVFGWGGPVYAKY
jgi:outer membrane immunogenic protein